MLFLRRCEFIKHAAFAGPQGNFIWEREGIVCGGVIVYSVCILSDFSLDCSKVNSNLQWIPARVCVVWCETEMPSAGNFLKNIPKFSKIVLTLD